MSNLINYHRAAAGLGFNPIGGVDPNSGGNIFGLPGAGGGSSSGGSGINWNNVINGSLQTVAAIFGKNNNSPAAQYQTGLTPEQQLAIYQAQQQGGNPNAYASGAITSEGVMLGNTRISWPMIMLGVGVVYLIQSPGFSRRR